MAVAAERLAVELEERLVGELGAALAAHKALDMVLLFVIDRERPRYLLATLGAVQILGRLGCRH